MTHTASPPQGTPGLSRRQILTVFVGLMVGLGLAALDATIVATALPTIAGELGGLEQIAWLVTSYLLTSTAATPLFGKLSDLYGRRALFQVAIITFVVGSVLCAVSADMLQLILARGVQGIGGGGLMAMTFTIVGDVVAPRERGRYVGFITATFALASVVGPLLGGFFVDGPGWRWIFWVNVPLGAAALVITTSALNVPFARRKASVDWQGAALLVAAVVCVLLVTVWGGVEYPWTSPVILGLGAGALAAVGLFLWREQRASEPILPLALFRNPVFGVAVPVFFLIGAVMFGATAFLPLFLQAVTGSSATGSGLQLLPLMGGVTIASITSGRLTAITGRYKIYPVLGLAVATVGTALLALTMTATASLGALMVPMFLVGLGLGAAMPNMTLAVQNSVELRDMGVASSAVNFFRSLGGALGVSVFGAILAARLGVELAALVPDGFASIDAGTLASTPSQIRDLPEPVAAGVIEALSRAIRTVFAAAVPVAALGFVLTLFLPERPLKTVANVGAAPAED